MKPAHFLVGGLLMVALSFPAVPQARAAAPSAPRVVPGGVRLALSTALARPPAAPVAAMQSAPVVALAPGNPYLPRSPLQPVSPFPLLQVEPGAPRVESGGFLGRIAHAIPLLPDSGQRILPSIKKVYPTGEKPLVVVSFKCPTELVGVTPPTIKLLHEAVSLGMDGINRTGLLSFNLQQVCQ